MSEKKDKLIEEQAAKIANLEAELKKATHPATMLSALINSIKREIHNFFNREDKMKEMEAVIKKMEEEREKDKEELKHANAKLHAIEVFKEMEKEEKEEPSSVIVHEAVDVSAECPQTKEEALKQYFGKNIDLSILKDKEQHNVENIRSNDEPVVQDKEESKEQQKEQQYEPKEESKKEEEKKDIKQESKAEQKTTAKTDVKVETKVEAKKTQPQKKKKNNTAVIKKDGKETVVTDKRKKENNKKKPVIIDVPEVSVELMKQQEEPPEDFDRFELLTDNDIPSTDELPDLNQSIDFNIFDDSYDDDGDWDDSDVNI